MKKHNLKLLNGGPAVSDATDGTAALMERLRDLGVENALLMDGFDDCVVGILERFGMERVILYDKDLVIQKLMDGGIDSYEGALEYYSYNQLGGWHGDGTPGFLEWLPEL